MSIETKPRIPAVPLTVEAVARLFDEHFPGMLGPGRSIGIVSVAARTARLRLVPDSQSIRPGGTISGPAMFMLADLAVYVALIATSGASAIAAVTSNLNINFLARPEPKPLIADASIIRLGRRLAYAEVRIAIEGADELVAHATATYALAARF
jgi:uncharacterized protein (TIGR00369 family)